MVVKFLKSQQGVTLIEFLLVLTIASILLVMGLLVYQTYRNEQAREELKYNVNTLFQGLNYYYRANCIQYETAAGTITKPGSLDPNNIPPSAQSYPVPITALQTLLSNWSPSQNSLLNYDDPEGKPPYVTQFNLKAQDRTIDTNQGTATPIGTVYLWQAQVAVRINNTEAAQSYQYALGADCVSSYEGGGLVTPCTPGTQATEGEYIVWERLPSFVSPQINLETWQTQQSVTQFLQMYNTYPMLNLTNGWTKQDYQCGS